MFLHSMLIFVFIMFSRVHALEMYSVESHAIHTCKDVVHDTCCWQSRLNPIVLVCFPCQRLRICLLRHKCCI